LTVCYDIRFPELYRILALEGALLFTVPAHFTLYTGKDHWELLLRARAVENQCFVAAATQIGETLPGRQSYGRASIVDPWGIVLAQARYEQARLAAVEDLRRHPELDHDEEVWVRFTEDIVRGMGGGGPAVSAVALGIVRRWEHAVHFELYDDVLPALAELRRAGL